MRLFLAITLPDEVCAGVARAMAPAQAAAPQLRWVGAERLHLTMKFLGERPEGDVARIAESLGRALEAVPAFSATLRDAGAFPNFRRPRAVWLGMHPHDLFANMSARLGAALAALGIAEENRPFRPHVTLGRLTSPLPAPQGESLERALRAIRQSWTVPVREVVLMRSTLGAGGSTYTPLAVVPLGGARQGATAAPRDAAPRDVSPRDAAPNAHTAPVQATAPARGGAR